MAYFRPYNINKVAVRLAQLVLGWVYILFAVGKPILISRIINSVWSSLRGWAKHLVIVSIGPLIIIRIKSSSALISSSNNYLNNNNFVELYMARQEKQHKAKFSHTCYRAFGSELILVYRQSARK